MSESNVSFGERGDIIRRGKRKRKKKIGGTSTIETKKLRVYLIDSLLTLQIRVMLLQLTMLHFNKRC